ncbi:hypothetical protein ASE17_15845 [Phenylobacterium sp. Root77]|uniref:hypothetical protein n=1 Tax=unclassified Phenylobacterium TaxID=2640670 RepID=UPI0006F25244|nr:MULTISPECIES: hypothetical protein [unclassified Phenylobacterium]KQW70370.1 hypothetical protein ASC73_09725 [Phenylobacterium sp. Root1277]KQW91209.1 hypothetical protein ASC79_17865 [Phenylobacterium sp. Root1290]KRC39154.1 hypothetical protein ASE17_15845 [Phenylobacterium sp. Root77]
MLAERMSMAADVERGVARWFLDRAIYELHRLWACYWWLLRAHVAARHFIPRASLEAPPAEWMKVMQAPCETDQ